MAETKLLNREDVVQRLLAIIDARPDNVNPTVASFCVYTDDDGRHCLAGQFAADEGWDVPGPPVWMGVDSVARSRSWPLDDSGRTALRLAQIEADAATHRGEPWSSIRAEVAALAEVSA